MRIPQIKFIEDYHLLTISCEGLQRNSDKEQGIERSGCTSLLLQTFGEKIITG